MNTLPTFQDEEGEVIHLHSKQWFDEWASIQDDTDKQYKELYNVCQSDHQVTKRSCGAFFNLSWLKKASRAV